MSKLIKKLLQIGITNSTSDDEARLTRLCNGLAISFAAVTIAYAPIYFYFNETYLLLGVTILASIYAVSMYLNSLTKYYAARVLLQSNAVISVLIYALASESNTRLYFFLNAILPFVLFKHEQTKSKWLLVLVSVSGYIISHELDKSYYSAFAKSEVGSDVLTYMVILSSFGLVTFCAFYLNHHASKSEAQLRDENIKTSSLLNLVCHDLSTPLMIAESKIRQNELLILENENLNQTYPMIENIKSNIEAAQKAHETMDSLINSVRQMRANRSGKHVSKLVPVDIEKIMENAQFMFAAKMKKKDLKYSFENKLTGNYTILAEEVSLSNSVVNNILSNSIKFSLAGQKIEVTAVETDHHITITISDKGLGIPVEILPKIFDPSEYTTRKGTLGEKGTGFGLPLVKSFMDSYNAHVLVNSRTALTHPGNHGTEMSLVFSKVPIPTKKNT
ncbi:HAMP domain-containing histidine kinase [bacterium]|nr:HAMP domain-containing histidine kinase [bacterium]